MNCPKLRRQVCMVSNCFKDRARSGYVSKEHVLCQHYNEESVFGLEELAGSAVLFKACD